MSYIRSARIVPMRLFRDDLGNAPLVQWYFVPEDRNVVPYAHPFGSRDADEFRDFTLLGEVYSKRRYCTGVDPVGLHGIGLCGSQNQWFNGASISDPVRPINPLTGQQCCCGPGTLQVTGATVAGGEVAAALFTDVAGGSVAGGDIERITSPLCNGEAPFEFFAVLDKTSGTCPTPSVLKFRYLSTGFGVVVYECLTDFALAGGHNTLEWELVFNWPAGLPGCVLICPPTFRSGSYSCSPFGGLINLAFILPPAWCPSDMTGTLTWPWTIADLEGGSVAGGEVESALIADLEGGSVAGGEVEASPIYPLEGGSAEGGEVSTLIGPPQCSGRFHIDLACTVTRLSGTCSFPASLTFTWDGVKWACVDNIALSGGSNTNTWWLHPDKYTVGAMVGSFGSGEVATAYNCTLPSITNITTFITSWCPGGGNFRFAFANA